jgi:hypothetical protein
MRGLTPRTVWDFRDEGRPGQVIPRTLGIHKDRLTLFVQTADDIAPVRPVGDLGRSPKSNPEELDAC